MDIEKVYRDAINLAGARSYEAARDTLDRLLDEEPDHVDAIVLRGKIEYYLKRHKTAQGYFERALTLNPGHHEALFCLRYYQEKRLLRTFLRLSAGMICLAAIIVASAVIGLSVFYEENSERSLARLTDRMDRMETLLRTGVMSRIGGVERDMGELHKDFGALYRLSGGELDAVRKLAKRMDDLWKLTNHALDKAEKRDATGPDE